MASPETFDIPIGKVVGRKGDTGNGIKSIALLSTSWLNKTYRITMTDETTFDFVVTDGNGITGATFDAQTNALTLTFNNGTSFTTPSLKGTKGDTGNGISRIEKTGTDGLVDTYTVTYTDGQTFTYTVTNGADGVSPEVTVTQISGGHTVEIEDADGVKTFDVLDGEVTEARLAEALATKADVIVDTASGAIASFSDGADNMPIRKLVAQIEPVQDLHGYDSPWPAGGGKNKANIDAAFPTTLGGITFTKNEDGSITINGTANSDVSLILMTSINIENGTWTISGVPANSAGGALSIWARNSSVGSEYARTYNGKAEQVDITTGTVYIYCTIDSGTVVNNVKAYIQLEEGSTATAYAPYSNECPISGWTGAEIEQANANLLALPFVYFNAVPHNKDNAFFVKAGGYTISWSGSSATSWRLCIFMCDRDGNELSDDKYVPSNGMNYQFNNKQWIAGANGSIKNHTITIVEDCYIRFYFALGDTTASTTFDEAMLNIGNSRATDYHPYTGNQISVTFPSDAGIVYGGTLTINPDRTGTLVVEDAKVVLDGSVDEDISSYNSSYDGFSVRIDNAEINSWIPATQLKSNYMRAANSRGQITPPIPWSLCTYYNITDDKWFFICGTGFTETTDLRNYLAENPLTVVYPLATPITYTLTASEVSGILTTLYGTNNVWADTGDTEVEYPCDTRLFIERKISEALGG